MVSKSRQQQQNSVLTQKETVTVKKKDHWAGEMNRSIRKAQSMVQVLFTGGGFLNCFKKKQEHQTRDRREGRGDVLKKRKKPKKPKQNRQAG